MYPLIPSPPRSPESNASHTTIDDDNVHSNASNTTSNTTSTTNTCLTPSLILRIISLSGHTPKNLQSLSLSSSALTSLGYYPTPTSPISPGIVPLPSLINLDLRRNSLTNLSGLTAHYLPSLQYLNLTHNAIQSFPHTLKSLKSLSHLDLRFNPICVTKNYRSNVINSLQPPSNHTSKRSGGLKVLDGRSITGRERRIGERKAGVRKGFVKGNGIVGKVWNEDYSDDDDDDDDDDRDDRDDNDNDDIDKSYPEKNVVDESLASCIVHRGHDDGGVKVRGGEGRKTGNECLDKGGGRRVGVELGFRGGGEGGGSDVEAREVGRFDAGVEDYPGFSDVGKRDMVEVVGDGARGKGGGGIMHRLLLGDYSVKRITEGLGLEVKGGLKGAVDGIGDLWVERVEGIIDKWGKEVEERLREEGRKERVEGVEIIGGVVKEELGTWGDKVVGTVEGMGRRIKKEGERREFGVNTVGWIGEDERIGVEGVKKREEERRVLMEAVEEGKRDREELRRMVEEGRRREDKLRRENDGLREEIEVIKVEGRGREEIWKGNFKRLIRECRIMIGNKGVEGTKLEELERMFEGV